MIYVHNLISSLENVPEEWIFEHYLKLNQSLSGQNIKMLSVFNIKDKVPSMFVYVSPNGKYKFKDFSSGYQGDGLTLVQHLYNLPNRQHAALKITADYQAYVDVNSVKTRSEFKIHDKFKVVDYEIRHWTTDDQKYWMRYGIGSRLLECYNVAPLKFFKISRVEQDNTVTTYVFEKPRMYGYFKNDGTLYKIYMPANKLKKFFKVENYVQGIEQLSLSKKYLIIVSSLKDLMTFQKFNIGNVECIAPDSENTMLGESVIDKLKPHYSSICVLFDNDEPGIKAAERYKQKYGFNYVVLNLEKDLSDSVEKYGVDKTRNMLLPLLKQAL